MSSSGGSSRKSAEPRKVADVPDAAPISGRTARNLVSRNGTGSRWSRVHHSLIAASSLMIAWFFLTFHIAGTTLIY